MLEIIFYGLVWCFAVYGILVMIQEIIRNNTYKKVEENIKLILTVKDAEDGIENYIREIMMGKNFYNNLVVIDMGSHDDIIYILKELEKDMNIKVLNNKEGKEYLKKEI